MPTHPPLYVNTAAGSLGHNKCYEFLVNSYTQNGLDTWLLRELRNQFGNIQVDILIEEQFLEVEQKEYAQLAFKSIGTEPQRLLEHLEEGIRHFEELQRLLSQIKRCSSARLRDLISHLRNFGLVEVINMPATAICAIALSTPEYEQQLDTLSKSVEFMDFPYIESQEDEIKEHKRLMELEEKMQERLNYK